MNLRKTSVRRAARSSRARWLGCALALIVVQGCATTPQAPPEPGTEEKLARLLKLEDERSLGDGEVVNRLADTAARVRARAATVLARVGSEDAAARLTRQLDDRTNYVRAGAAFSLGSLPGELPAESIQALLDGLEDSDIQVRARVIEALGKKGGDDVLEAIARALAETAPTGGEPYEWTEDMELSTLDDPRLDLRLGLYALARRASLRWSWALLATEGSTPRYVWWPAAWAVSELQGEERAPLLRYFAGSLDPELRLWGTRGYRSVRASDVPQHLTLLLSDPSERVRIQAVRSAAALGLTGVVPRMLALLGEDTLHVQVTVLDALSSLEAPMAVEPLIDQLGSDSRWIRAHALPALARQDIDGFWLLLSGLGDDPEWQVRAALADLLGKIEGDRPEALLRSIAEDADARVRARALGALARRAPQSAAPALVAHLKGPDPFERVAAAEALGRLDAPEAAVSVQQAFFQEEGSEPRVRARLLAALGELDRALARNTARSAIDDTDYLVRRAAAALLAEDTSASLAVRPRPSERSVADYRALVNPRYTPQAFIETRRGSRIEVELFVLDAPLTVDNFMRLARSGFYDGLSVHQVEPNGFVATGDPRGDGNGGPGYSIRSEINERPVVRGTLVMIDHGKDTGGSQFLITHLPQPQLDGRVTVFGQVTSGMSTVDRLEPGDTIDRITIWDGYTSPHRAPQ